MAASRRRRRPPFIQNYSGDKKMLEIHIKRSIIRVYFRSYTDESVVKSQLNVDSDGVYKAPDNTSQWWLANGREGVTWYYDEKKRDNALSKDNKERNHRVSFVIPPYGISFIEVDSA